MLSNTLVDSIKAIPFGSRNFIVQCADRVTNPPNSLLRDIALKRTVGSSHCFFISGLSKITKKSLLNILALIHNQLKTAGD